MRRGSRRRNARRSPPKSSGCDEEHRDLDAAIEALREAGQVDQLQFQRLKKRKLLLRDKLARLEDQLTPDIIA